MRVSALTEIEQNYVSNSIAAAAYIITLRNHGDGWRVICTDAFIIRKARGFARERTFRGRAVQHPASGSDGN